MIKNRFASKKRRKTFLDDIWQTLMLANFLSSESRVILCISYAESRQKISEVKKRQGVRKKGKKWGPLCRVNAPQPPLILEGEPDYSCFRWLITLVSEKQSGVML